MYIFLHRPMNRFISVTERLTLWVTIRQKSTFPIWSFTQNIRCAVALPQLLWNENAIILVHFLIYLNYQLKIKKKIKFEIKEARNKTKFIQLEWFQVVLKKIEENNFHQDATCSPNVGSCCSLITSSPMVVTLLLEGKSMFISHNPVSTSFKLRTLCCKPEFKFQVKLVKFDMFRLEL